jgi:hypothetical protein
MLTLGQRIERCRLEPNAPTDPDDWHFPEAGELPHALL